MEKYWLPGRRGIGLGTCWRGSVDELAFSLIKATLDSIPWEEFDLQNEEKERFERLPKLNVEEVSHVLPEL